jgi:hypothetical protein
VTRLDEIEAGLNESYPMYWTGPRYRVSDRDLRVLVEVARAAMNMRDAMNARRELRLCDPGPECRREVNRVARECEREFMAALAPLVGEDTR